MARAVAESSTTGPADAVAELLPEEELFRAQLYGLLARLLAAPADAPFLRDLARIGSDGSELGQAFAALARAAVTTPDAVARDYHELFIGLGRGELIPYGSYYLTGFLNERPLAALRTALSSLGIVRAAGVKEPEDHIAALCEVMAGLITGAFGAPQPVLVQRRFFEAHLAPWAGRFFADLEGARAAGFYAEVARVGALFIAIETTAFAMAA